MSFCLSVWQSACPFIYLPPSLSVCLLLCLSVSLWPCTSLYLCFIVSQYISASLICIFFRLVFFSLIFSSLLVSFFFDALRVLVLFLQTVSASLLTLRCFFNFFNQIFGLLLFHVLLFSVVCCFYIDTVTMEVSRHHPSNHTPHRVWSNRSRSLKKLQTSFSKAAYSTLKWKKKKRFETLILVDVVLIVSYCLYFTHSFPVHPFYTPWKHQKTVSCSDVFRG